MRIKLKLLEGSRVRFLISDSNLVLVPVDGQGSVKASIGVCGTSGSGSILGSGLENEGDNE